jgi:hypothetical protein
MVLDGFNPSDATGVNSKDEDAETSVAGSHVGSS